MSSAYDGSFFSFCEGTILFDHCTMARTGDDSMNVSGKYLTVTSIDSPNATLTATVADGTWCGPTPVAGEVFDHIDPDTLLPHAVQLIVTSGSTSSGVHTIHCSGSLPANLQVGDLLISRKYIPQLTIKDCDFTGSYARSLFLSTEMITIENNNFRYPANAAIALIGHGNSGRHFQGPVPKHVDITGNTFVGVGGPNIYTYAHTATPADIAPAYAIDDLQIMQNSFTFEENGYLINGRRYQKDTSLTTFPLAYFTTAFFFHSLGNATITANDITGLPAGDYDYGIYAGRSDDVLFQNNTFNGIDYTDGYEPTDGSVGNITRLSSGFSGTTFRINVESNIAKERWLNDVRN